jgi:hypothetical protein
LQNDCFGKGRANYSETRALGCIEPICAQKERRLGATPNTQPDEEKDVSGSFRTLSAVLADNLRGEKSNNCASPFNDAKNLEKRGAP